MEKTVAIFGAGPAGIHLYGQIQQNETGYKVVALIDNFVTGKIGELTIMKPEDYFQSSNRATMNIIAAGAQKTLGIMLGMLCDNRVRDIYMLHDIAGKCKLPLLKNGKPDSRWIRKINFSDVKPILPYIEIPITDVCNLNCKGCLFACNNSGKPEHMDAEQIIRDIKRMAELFYDIPWIRILGGEPLIHPELKFILKEIRRIYPASEIDLCTNGLMLPKMDEEFYEIIRTNDVSIHVSGYKPTYPVLESMDDILKKHGIYYTILKREEFFKFYTADDSHDMEENFRECPTSGCPELYKGRIMRCSAVIAFEKFNEQYGTSYKITENTDWYDIHNPLLDGVKLQQALKHASYACRYCDLGKQQKFHWEPGGQNPGLEDYVVN